MQRGVRVPNVVKVLPLYMLMTAILFAPSVTHRARAHHINLLASHAQQALQAKPVALVKQYRSGVPVRIIIPSLAIDLPITAQHYNNQIASWPVNSSSANYAVESQPVNNRRGKSFIYGHWTQQIFGATTNMKVGAKAYVYTDNGHLFAYTFTSFIVVAPNDAAEISDSNSPAGIKIMTCQGSLAQQRRIMSFELGQSV